MSEQERLGKLRWILSEAGRSIGVPMSVEVVVKFSNAMNAVMESEGIRLLWQSSFDSAFRELVKEEGDK